MKKAPKIIISIIIVLFAIYSFLLSDFNPIFKNEEFVYLTNSLKETRKENFKSIVEIYNEIHKTVKEKRCSCETATTFIGPYRHGYSLTKKLYLLKVEKEFSNNECLKFQLIHYDFGNGNIGVKNASKFYFGKTVEQLNEEEKIIIVVMLENSGLYNPLRNKTGVINKARIYQRILRKKTSR
ncbi:transglycosylase domain-containing protein [Flavobacterium sp. K77]|uniref:transglycosylase domain-containing protein n=1 Tax=Flavobacterium sp. K77 TaxID=2910676 RepID=UPI001F207849|nr:transglycosylase domain-containing protein [Flavobacterium sp. K77]MCF6142560.1 transglycosylase domain-containing protein [Flavobacterium sp. K77]